MPAVLRHISTFIASGFLPFFIVYLLELNLIIIIAATASRRWFFVIIAPHFG